MKNLIYLLIVVFLPACVTLPGRKIPKQLPPVVDNSTQATHVQKPVGDVQAFPLAQPQGMDPVAMSDMQPIDADTVSLSSNNTAVLALLDQSDIHSQAGENDAAGASLERALRIEPRNPTLWSKLAAVRLQQGQGYQAEQLALKSNTLSINNPGLRIENWHIIADARKSRSDSDGVIAAQKKIRDLESR